VFDRLTELLQGISKDQGMMWGSLGQVMPTWLEESGFANILRISRATYLYGSWAGQRY
jgi:hypothetical protein